MKQVCEPQRYSLAWRRRQKYSATWCGGFHPESGLAFMHRVSSFMVLSLSWIKKTGTSENCMYLNELLGILENYSVLDAVQEARSETGFTVQMHNSVQNRSYNFCVETTSDYNRYCHRNTGLPLKNARSSEDFTIESKITTPSIHFLKPAMPHPKSPARSFEKQTRSQIKLLWNFANIHYKWQHKEFSLCRSSSNRKQSIQQFKKQK